MTETRRPTNESIARALEELALRLEDREANPFRVQAYLQAADVVRSRGEPVADVLDREGPEGLMALPHVGERLASRIAGFVRTGKLALLESLDEEMTPAWRFRQIPGIGEEMAHRIVDALGVTTLEELELAAHDGRLAALEGFGDRRVRALRAQLDALLRRDARRRRQRERRRRQAEMFALPSSEQRPSVDALLAVDRAYRRKADRDELFRIAPRRFNPDHEAWLPVWRTSRNGWKLTALFSNTARAHELEKTHDWVVLYYERDGVEGQATVVTETRGDLKGRRVVRGREAECRRLYDPSTRQAA